MNRATANERNIAMAEDYKSGVLSPALSEKYGVSRQRVWQILQRLGVKRTVRRPDVDGECIVGTVLAKYNILRMSDLAEALQLDDQIIYKRVKSHPHWPDAIAVMAMRRHQLAANRSRTRLKEVYEAKSAELGRPLSVKEMREARIWANSLRRIYGTNYINKFRADLGEVPDASAQSE
jgi:hypothetical protein